MKRYSRPEDVTAPTAGAAAPAASVRTELPPWLRGAAPAEAAADNLLRPSDPAADEAHPVRTGESIQLRARALQRGTLVHRLLQSLPDVAAGTPPRCGAAVSRPQRRRRLDRG